MLLCAVRRVPRYRSFFPFPIRVRSYIYIYTFNRFHLLFVTMPNAAPDATATHRFFFFFLIPVELRRFLKVNLTFSGVFFFLWISSKLRDCINTARIKVISFTRRFVYQIFQFTLLYNRFVSSRLIQISRLYSYLSLIRQCEEQKQIGTHWFFNTIKYTK